MAVEQRNIQEVLEFRKLLEPQIASLAARNISGTDLALLREKLNEQKAVIAQGGSGSALDAEFHLLIAKATGNRVLYEVLVRIHDIVSESRDFTLQTEERRDWAVMTHERVLAALARRDPEAAFQEMHSHIDYVEKIALEWID
jgi:GntR family transcriptional repressor for pyruvate dehydrogenase complex